MTQPYSIPSCLNGRLYRWCVFFPFVFGVFLLSAQMDTFGHRRDTIAPNPDYGTQEWASTATTLYANALTAPSIFQSVNRYSILSDQSGILRTDMINWRVQKLLEANDRTQLSFEDNLRFLESCNSPWTGELGQVSESEMKFAIWRTQLANLQKDSDLKTAVHYGMEYLLANGKMQWKDFMPFVTMLMQEHYDYHYDHKRVKVKGATAGGIITTTDIFRTFRPYDSTSVAGVCRDIHDVGLRLLREMGNEFFSKRYPQKEYHMDDYLFLTSWTTQSSQHVTVVMTDPTDIRKSYELDWGRLIEKYDNVGYDHGRNYGNVYRIWKYDANSDIIRPIDSKKTLVGKIMDERVYNRFEIDAFEGIRNEEPFPQTGNDQKVSSRLSLSFAAGNSSNSQRFLQLSLVNRTKEKQWGNILRYTGAWAFQTMAMEESKKKNIMYPNYEFTTAMAYYAFPRYIGHLSSSNLRLSKNMTAGLFLAGSFELFLNFNQFNTTTADYPTFTNSGDASVFLSQGIQLRYKNKKEAFHAEVKFLNRSFLIPKDVRLMSVKPAELLASLVLIHSAQDLFIQTGITFGRNTRLSTTSILEYTSLHNLLAKQELNLQYNIRKGRSLGITAGSVRNLKGMPRFWYTLNKSWLEVSYHMPQNHFNISAIGQYFNDREFTSGLRLIFQL